MFSTGRDELLKGILELRNDAVLSSGGVPCCELPSEDSVECEEWKESSPVSTHSGDLRCCGEGKRSSSDLQAGLSNKQRVRSCDGTQGKPLQVRAIPDVVQVEDECSIESEFLRDTRVQAKESTVLEELLRTVKRALVLSESIAIDIRLDSVQGVQEELEESRDSDLLEETSVSAPDKTLVRSTNELN